MLYINSDIVWSNFISSPFNKVKLIKAKKYFLWNKKAFNNFILKVLLYNDKITIVYNTSLNPAEEIYSRPNDNDNDNNGNDNETTIYKKEIEISDDENKDEASLRKLKKLPFEFKRQLFGGEGGIWTLAPFYKPTPLAGEPLRPLGYFSM